MDYQEMFKALAHPFRLEILETLLKEGPKRSCELVDREFEKQEVVGHCQARVSASIQVLFKAGLIEKEQAGTSKILRVKEERMERVLQVLFAGE